MAGYGSVLVAVMEATEETAPVGTEAGSTPPSELGRLARGGAMNLVGAVVSSAVNILLVVVIARGLSRSQAGRFFTATSVFLLVSMIGKLGANIGLVYFIARLRALGRSDLIGARLRNALVPVLAAASALGALLWLFAGRLAQVIVASNASQIETYIKILAVFVPMAALADVTLAATRGFRRMRPTVLLDLVSRPALQLALTVVVLAVDAPLGWVAVAWGGPYLPEMVAALLSLRSIRRSSGGRPKAKAADAGAGAGAAGLGARDFWRFTGPRAVTSIVQLALQRLDIILIAALRGPAEAAVYTAATRFLVAGQLGSQAMSTVVQPRLSELLAVGDRSGAGAVYQVATGWVVLITWPIYLLAIIFSTEYLAIFGKGYSGATSVIALLACTMLVATMCGMVDIVLIMAGRTTWTLANSIVALLVMVGLDLLLIPHWGIVGAAVGWSAAILTNNLLPLAQTVVSLGLHPFGSGTIRAMLLAVACFGVIPLTARWVAGSTTLLVVAAVAFGAAGYAIGCHQMRGELSLDALRDLWKRRSAPRAA